MKMRMIFCLCLLWRLVHGTVFAQEVQKDFIKEWIAHSLINGQPPPFSFQYQNRSSLQFLSGCEKNHNQTTSFFRDPKTGLQIRCEATLYRDFHVVEWVVYFKNTGQHETPIIENIQALDITLPGQKNDGIVHYAKGAVCSWDDYQPLRRVLNKKSDMIVQPGGGRSSSDFLPFFNLQQADSTGLIIAVGWSGEWQMQFTTDSTRRTRIRSGMAQTHLKLFPGEEIRTPRMALLSYSGNPATAQNLWRRFVLAHHRPLVKGKPFPMPVFYATWGGTKADVHLADITQLIAADLAVDAYWIDAEWFGQGLWHQTVGDWRVKKDLYPLGFKPISNRLHQAGREFLVWFEPERICTGTPWYTEYRSWLLAVPKAQRHYNWGNSQNEPDWVRWESLRNQICEDDLLFNLADPAARKFLTDYISDLIDQFGIDYYRHDANIAPLEFWRAADAPDRRGWTEIQWVQGLYAFWDELLRRHPGLIIDNCASGGRRIDLETMGRSTPFWRTDYPGDPIAKQCHTFGISSWVPLNATGNVRPATDDLYTWRSTWSSSIVVDLSGIAQWQPDDEKLVRAKTLLNQYQDIQPYYLGDYYPLTCYSQAADAWMAWQFNRPEQNDGMVQVFRRTQSISESAKLRLDGLADDDYIVRNLDQSDPKVISGRMLMENGLIVTLNGRPGAAVFIYQKK